MDVCDFGLCSHFETTVEDVLSIYKRVLGEELDLSVLPETAEEDDY